MSGLSIALILQAALLASSNETSYTQAYQTHQNTGRPLVVLVGADWCPGCREMKQSVIPALKREGGLDDVAFAMVDTDREGELAGKLMRGSSIPQLIIYHDSPTGVKRVGVVGAQSTAAVKNLIRKGIEQASSVATGNRGSGVRQTSARQ